MLTLIISVVGIISTLLAWFLNPKQVVYSELDSIYKQLEDLYVLRDKALIANDSNSLTDISARITGLCDRKKILLQRLG